MMQIPHTSLALEFWSRVRHVTGPLQTPFALAPASRVCAHLKVGEDLGTSGPQSLHHLMRLRLIYPWLATSLVTSSL